MSEERVIELERQVQSLRLELTEQKKTAERLKLELERQRGEENARLVSVQLERLFNEVASPTSQLLMQAHLLRVEEKPLQANDILSVGLRLVRVLEDYGLSAVGMVGEQVAFDQNQHDLLSTDMAVSPGESVVIRLVGIAYQGKLLRRAGVTGV
jgi:hypothetical protein